ncbi:PREDICTED: LIM/homeobox protein Lhx2-like, partial [Rhagoletis zephyria]|uniref:LIM/homeobox protein Lhx2-like n=1 Tax=Rhagoletis zephyria TaxID=28612 RepID=UPI0008115413
MRRCSRCGEGIYASELVMRVRDQNVYHVQCFTCAWCATPLAQGDLFGVRDSLVYCRTHYEMSSSSPPSSPSPPAPSSAPPSPLASPPPPPPSSLSPSPPTRSSTGRIHGSGGGGGGGNAGPPSSSAPGSAPNGQSPTTPHSIRKGRPRKRKNTMGASSEAQQANDSMTLLNSSGGGNNSSCTHDSLSPTGARSSHSPGGSLDGGPLSGLAASIENSCLSGSSSGGLGGLSHSSQRTKRMRTSFKHHQLRTMKTYFSVNQNPDAKDLKQLAQKTGLSKRVLQVWFQNARAKWRRNNLKMMPDGPELSLNGQTLLGSLGHPSTPSTVIGSPGGSTRPFSSPSPSSALSPSTMHDGGSCGGGGG